MTRLNKFLASCGLGSRRRVEDYILSGDVTVNGQPVTDLGYRVQDGDEVAYCGRTVARQTLAYYAIYKPRGYLCAVSDPNYPVVLDLLPPECDELRLFPIGRLDLQSEGLILVTNDGDFAQKLIHPSAGLTKEYEVRLNRALTDGDLKALRRGAFAEGKKLVPLSVDLMRDRRPVGWWARFCLGEGVRREIRHIAEAHGLRVEVLFRRAIGHLRLARLKPGQYREMTRHALWDGVTKGGTV